MDSRQQNCEADLEEGQISLEKRLQQKINYSMFPFQIICMIRQDHFYANLKPSSKALTYSLHQAKDQTGQFPSDHICIICRYLIIDPLTCKACSNLFCLSCITNWGQTKNKCPLCFSSPLTLTNITEEQQVELETGLILQGCPLDGCTESESKMSYGQLVGHLKTSCIEVEIECPLCKVADFKRDQAKSHFEQGCSKRTQEFDDLLLPNHSLRQTQSDQVVQLSLLLSDLTSLELPPIKQSLSIEFKGRLQVYRTPSNSNMICRMHDKQLECVLDSGSCGKDCTCCRNTFKMITRRRKERAEESRRFRCEECDMNICMNCVESGGMWEDKQ